MMTGADGGVSWRSVMTIHKICNLPGETSRDSPEEQRRQMVAKKVQDQRTPMPIKPLPQDDEDGIPMTEPFLKKRADYLQLQRCSAETSFIEGEPSGRVLQLQNSWEQWRSNNIFPTWITAKLKCGTYQKKEAG